MTDLAHRKMTAIRELYNTIGAYPLDRERAERAICGAAAEITGLTPGFCYSAAIAVDTAGRRGGDGLEVDRDIEAALRRFADLAEEEEGPRMTNGGAHLPRAQVPGERPPGMPLQSLETVSARLREQRRTLGSWEAVAASCGVSVGTAVRVANGYDPCGASIRLALGLPPLLHLSPGAGIHISEGSVVLRSSRLCACGCGSSFIPNSWNHVFLPKHRIHRKRSR